MRKNTYLTIQSWMITDLGLSGNDLLVYAVIYGFSQDGESRFIGSRQYIADWCGCTVRSVQNILNDLIERGLLTKYERTVNGVKQCEYVANFTASEIFSPGPNNIDNTIDKNKNTINNIDNNIDNNITSTFSGSNRGQACSNDSEDLQESEDEFETHGYSKEELKKEKFLGTAGSRHKQRRTRTPSLYDKCAEEVRCYTKSLALQDALYKYLNFRISVKDKPLYGVEQWKALLNKLSEVSGETIFDSSIEKRLAIVNKSLEQGWLSFYEMKTNNVRSPAGEMNQVNCRKGGDTISDEKF